MYRKWHFGIINILMDSCSIKFMKMKIKNITVNERHGTDLMGLCNSSSKHFKCLWFNCRQNKKFTCIVLWFLYALTVVKLYTYYYSGEILFASM